jgi:penicillin-binding protein 1A
VHFSNITYGQGGTMALPIWALYMKKCYADEELNVSKEEFTRPENLRIRVDCSVPAVNDSIKVPLLDELDDLGFK